MDPSQYHHRYFILIRAFQAGSISVGKGLEMHREPCHVLQLGQVTVRGGSYRRPRHGFLHSVCPSSALLARRRGRRRTELSYAPACKLLLLLAPRWRRLRQRRRRWERWWRVRFQVDGRGGDGGSRTALRVGSDARCLRLLVYAAANAAATAATASPRAHARSGGGAPWRPVVGIEVLQKHIQRVDGWRLNVDMAGRHGCRQRRTVHPQRPPPGSGAALRCVADVPVS